MAFLLTVIPYDFIHNPKKVAKVLRLLNYRIDSIKGPFILYECGVGWWKFMGRGVHFRGVGWGPWVHLKVKDFDSSVVVEKFPVVTKRNSIIHKLP